MADPLMDGKPEGAKFMQRAIDAGADPTEVQNTAIHMSKRAIDQGAPYDDVMNYWGFNQKKVDVSPMGDKVKANLDALTPEDHTRIAGNTAEYLAAGFGTEPSGLLLNGKPQRKMPDHPNR